MNQNQFTKKGGTKGKANRAQARRADELTAKRILAILSDPKTPGGVAGRLQKLVSGLGECTGADSLETPAFYADAFDLSAYILREGVVRDDLRGEAERFHEALAQYAERHEPRAHKVARRCAEIYAKAKGDGASYFIETVDAVLDGGPDGLMPNPDSKYFPPLFVEAWDDRGPRDRRVRTLLDLIRRIDEGADLNTLAAEDKRRWEEYAAKREPKDTRLIRRLSEVLRAPKTTDDANHIGEIFCTLSNLTGADDLHPEIFPALARVVLREARKRPGLRKHLRELEAIAGEKGGRK